MLRTNRPTGLPGALLISTRKIVGLVARIFSGEREAPPPCGQWTT